MTKVQGGRLVSIAHHVTKGRQKHGDKEIGHHEVAIRLCGHKNITQA